jgi:hypothetical protein
LIFTLPPCHPHAQHAPPHIAAPHITPKENATNAAPGGGGGG